MSFVCSAALLLATLSQVAPFDRFDARATGHSWTNAYLLALASDAGYRGKVLDLPGDTLVEKFRHEFEPLGLNVVEFIDTDTIEADTQALVLTNDAIVLVLFGGSEVHGALPVVQDWLLTDAMINLVPFLDVHVHAGFRRGVTTAYPQIKATVEPLTRDGRSLWLAGHSLGGALASLTAYRLEQDGIPVRGVCTYGSPRVGDADWVEKFEALLGARARHWMHSMDPVVMSPPTLAKRPYASMTSVQLIDPEKGIRQDTGFIGFGLPNPWEHRMSAYANHIYHGMSEEARETLPVPPPVCGVTQKLVGVHPATDWPLCKSVTARKIEPDVCRADGGEVIGDWCVFELDEDHQHRVRKLK